MRIASVPVAGGRLEFCTSDQPDCAPGNISSGDGRLALTVGGSTTLPEIAVARCRRHDLEVSQLSDLNGPLLQQLELATPKSHWIKAADGHRSQAWVMKPPGARAGKNIRRSCRSMVVPTLNTGLVSFTNSRCWPPRVMSLSFRIRAAARGMDGITALPSRATGEAPTGQISRG